MNEEELKAWREDLVSSIVGKFNTKIDESTKHFLKVEEIEKIKSDFEGTVKQFSDDSLEKYIALIDEMKGEVVDMKELTKKIQEIVKAQAIDIEKLSTPIIPQVRQRMGRKDALNNLIKMAFLSKEFSAYKGRNYKGSTASMTISQNEEGKIILADAESEVEYRKSNRNTKIQEIETKATVDMTSHTGTVMISEVSDIVRDDTPTRSSHVRDLLAVSMTNQAQIVAGQVYDFTDSLTLGAVMLAENTATPESIFKSKENTWSLKRIGNAMRISKRELAVNGLEWVINKVMAKLPNATLFVEDTQLLFGDGVGNNVKGLAVDARAYSQIGPIFVATSFDSVATYNSGAQALVTFDVAHSLRNGDTLTIANAVEATYNAAHSSIEVINATQVVLDVAYVAEANVEVWTGTSTHAFYLAIDNAQEYDVLATADADLDAGEYECNGHVVHPSQGTQMGLLKDTTGNYLNIVKTPDGRIASINGKPVVYTTAMPYGKFLSGDFSRNGVELREFQALNIQFAEDVNSIKKNEIVIIIQEEIIFPIYNPFWFLFGKFSTAKAELETA